MPRRRALLILLIALQLLLGTVLVFNYRVLFWTEAPAVPPSRQLTPERFATLLALFAPLPNQATPETYQITPEMVDLGRMLYYDPRLSVNHRMSCNTCHLLDRYGVDHLPQSLGHSGEPVARNASSVYNAALHVAQFWDGRSPTVEDQAQAPILAMDEMGMGDSAYVERVLRSIPGYEPMFRAAFPNDPDPIRFTNAATAIGAFERGLMTPSRFDRFLVGDYSQLTEVEQRGFLEFATFGCANCHLGVTVGGLFYKKLGEKIPYETDDPGRARVTGSDADRHVFKVASLRNVAQTAPYLHDGSIATLEEMVVLMARHQLGKEISEEQIERIVAFLEMLTGEIPADYITPPALPASGPDTPLPAGIATDGNQPEG